MSSTVKLYVGGLPPSVDDSTVADMLSAYGQVESVTLSRDPVSLECLGFGFAKLVDEAACLRAIGALHNTFRIDPELTEIGPVQLRIVREASNVSRPVKLFIGGVPGSATGKMIRALFQPYGEIMDMFISPEKGYAFVKFGNVSDATAAMAGVNGTTLLNGVRPLEVRMAQSTKGMESDDSPTWAEYFAPGSGRPYYHNKITNVTTWERPDEMAPLSSQAPTGTKLQTGPEGSNIFVYGLPDNWGDSEFVSTFSKFGDILSSKIVYDRATKAHKGYGFISYANCADAETAVSEMNGILIDGRKLKVQIKRSFDKPY